MAVVHKTTLVPSKLELLTSWMPRQAWYIGAGEPELSRAGGFRLDDPADEVGIELMIVNDASLDAPVSYLTPLTYRGAPMPGAESHLVGTTEHGVLGRRWVYDGAYDPVFLAQLLAFIRGDVQAQAQSESHTLDPTVFRDLSDAGDFDGLDATRIDIDATGTVVSGLTLSSMPVELHVVRALNARDDELLPAGAIGEVVGNWTDVSGAVQRGVYAVIIQR